jgi:hypothetical protein
MRLEYLPLRRANFLFRSPLKLSLLLNNGRKRSTKPPDFVVDHISGDRTAINPYVRTCVEEGGAKSYAWRAGYAGQNETAVPLGGQFDRLQRG